MLKSQTVNEVVEHTHEKESLSTIQAGFDPREAPPWTDATEDKAPQIGLKMAERNKLARELIILRQEQQKATEVFEQRERELQDGITQIERVIRDLGIISNYAWADKWQTSKI